jgi:hypothetical protein
MKTTMCVAALAACAALGAGAQSSSPQPPRSPQAPRATQGQAPQGLAAFGWFAELANACWRGERAENRADVQCYTSQYNRFIRGTIKFYQGANLVAEGDSVFAYDPSAQVIVYSQWGSNGAFGLGEVALEKGDLVFRTRLPDGSEAPTRFVWQRIDADSFRVARQSRPPEADDGWKEDSVVTYKRVAR